MSSQKLSSKKQLQLGKKGLVKKELGEKGLVMAVNSFLLSEKTDIRSLCWKGFEYFYLILNNLFPDIAMDESSYKGYQLNYVTRLKSWKRRKYHGGEAYEAAQDVVQNAAQSSAWRVHLKDVKEPTPPPSENSDSRKSAPGDKLAGRYRSTGLDAVWSADTTQLGNYTLLLIMDQSSRQVVAHMLYTKPPSGKEVASVIERAILFHQPPIMFHTDSGGPFISEEVIKLLESQGILISRGSQKYRPHHNQVQERLNGTIKTLLVKKLCAKMPKKYRNKETAWLQLEEKPLKVARAIVHETIERYNAKFHRGIGASPNMHEEAQATYGKNLVLLGAKGTWAGEKAVEWNSMAVTKYAGNWQRFFIEFYCQNMEQHKRTQETLERNFRLTLEALKKEKLGLKSALDSSMADLTRVQDKLSEMEKDVDYMRRRESSREHEELERKARKARRQARVRQPLRSALFVNEYKGSLRFVSGDSFVECRDRVCLLILFLTGSRVSSLRLTRGSHLHTLKTFATSEEDQTLEYPSTKSIDSIDAAHINLPLPKEAAPLIRNQLKDIERLLEGRAPRDLVMSRSENSKDILSVSVLTRRLNRIMLKLSAQTGKFFRTQSFRIGLTTALVLKAGLEKANLTLAHKTLETTALYSRPKYTQADVRKALAAAYKTAPVRMPRAWRSRMK